jgi:hypothetical protein
MLDARCAIWLLYARRLRLRDDLVTSDGAVCARVHDMLARADGFSGADIAAWYVSCVECVCCDVMSLMCALRCNKAGLNAVKRAGAAAAAEVVLLFDSCEK